MRINPVSHRNTTQTSNQNPKNPAFKAVLFDSTINNIDDKYKPLLSAIKSTLDPYKRLDIILGGDENSWLRINYTPAKPYNMYLDDNLFDLRETTAKMGNVFRTLNKVSDNLHSKPQEIQTDSYVYLPQCDLEKVLQDCRDDARNFINKYCTKNQLS